MAFGSFTLTGTFQALDGTPAVGRVQVDGIPQVIIDTAGDKFRIGPRTVVLGSQGQFSISLPSDSTTGSSTGIGYRVTVSLKHQNVAPVEFYAPAIGASIDLADVTPQQVIALTPLGVSKAEFDAYKAANPSASAFVISSVATTATSSATLTANRHTPVDATSAARTMTLPSAPAGALLSVEKTDASTNAVNVIGTLRGVTSSTIALTSQYDARTFLSEGSGSWRPVSDHRTQSSLDAAYKTKPVATDRLLFVSKSGSDSNDGLSWAKGFLTVSAALAALGGNAGTIKVGAGTFTESNITPPNGSVIEGVSRTATVLQLTTDNGTLLNLTNSLYLTFQNLQLAFSSAVATSGILVKLSNAFACRFINVRIAGTWTSAAPTNFTGQTGIFITANAGDNFFDEFELVGLGVGCQPDSVINFFDNGRISNNKYGLQAGDPTGAASPGGIVASNCVFVGVGTAFVNITGRSGQWIFTGCWWDGQATDAIIVGSTTTVSNVINGPRIFVVQGAPYLTGAARSLTINAAGTVRVDGVVFGNTGSNPVDVTIPDPSKITRMGSWGTYYSLQNTDLTTVVPASWRSATGTNLQVFTASGTWTKPTTGVTTRVYMVGAGGGGGSGRRGAAVTTRCGGGGGGGGSRSNYEFDTASLTTTVAVTVGAGGSGGAAITTDDTNGANGGAGVTSTFGTYLRAGGASGGSGGTNATGLAGGGGTGGFPGGNGGAASVSGGVGGNGVGTSAASGGGSGGGITGGDVAGAGGAGFDSSDRASTATNNGGTVPGGAGVSAANRTLNAALPGGGAGGGAGSITGAAGAGGTGGLYGGGGGGGGASLNGNASGAGGAGGGAIVVVVTA